MLNGGIFTENKRKEPNAQILKYSNTQMLKYSNA